MENRHYQPGSFELYVGPMKSGKTKELIHHIDKIDYIDGVNYMILRPDIDVRDEVLKSRAFAKGLKANYVPSKDPNAIYDFIKKHGKDKQVIAFDEIQFFEKGLEEVIEHLCLVDNKQVLGAGLDLNFRGEPFEIMANLILNADAVTKTYGICEVPGCGHYSTRTQRLIDGKPALYSSPVVLVEGTGEEVYQTRCKHHHEVPGKPRNFYFE